MKRTVAVLLLCAGMGSCNPNLPSSPDLFVDFNAIDFPTTPLNSAGESFMNGVYDVVQGSSELGTPIVGRWVGNRWCMYSQHDVVFSISAGGFLGDSIKLTGYVRFVRSGSGSRVGLNIPGNEGAREVISGVIPPSLRIRGATEDGLTIDLRRVRNSNASPFNVLAHRCGGRNSDRLGISENSVEMIRFAGFLGATGVEMDVRRTRDNQLIIFHDDTFSPRTIQGAYLLGNVGDFDLEQIMALGTLIYGEKIPTLKQALTAVIDDTQLSIVWLDIKDPAEVPQVVQIQTERMAHAAAKGRGNLNILLGIPTQEVLNAYTPFKDTSDALCELDVGTVISLPRCRVWAPDWTREITPGDVAYLHSYNKKVFAWTVDLREIMVDYMTRIDGILTNYPSLVAAIHDSKE